MLKAKRPKPPHHSHNLLIAVITVILALILWLILAKSTVGNSLFPPR